MIWVSGLHAIPSERVMKKFVLRTLVLLVVVSATYAGLSGSTEKGSDPVPVSKPAGKFIPTEKLGAGDAVAFPVDI